MKLDNIGANQTVLTFGNNKIFFSYSTPVAGYLNRKFYQTSKRWSSTTSKHIRNFLEHYISENRPQEFFDGLLNQVSLKV